MKTKNLVLIAIFAALSLILSMFKVLQMPNGGSVTLYLVPLLFLGLKKNFKVTLTCCLITAILQLIFGGYILGFFQVFLDYIIPVCTVSLIAFSRNKGLALQILAIVLITVIMLTSYTISGIVYFKVNFIASVIYNATFLIPTIIVNFLIALTLSKAIKQEA